MATAEIRDEEDGTFCAFSISNCCAPLDALRHPIEVEDLFELGYYDSPSYCSSQGPSPFWVWPLFGPLLFENQTSDARDHCANERTFLSYLRLSIYMAIVSVAIVLSFHLKSQPSEAELAMATPLGVIFWLLSVACLLVGLGNYIREFYKFYVSSPLINLTHFIPPSPGDLILMMLWTMQKR